MRMTIRLDDALHGRARREAALRKTTLSALTEEGLRLVLSQSASLRRRRRVELPISREGGGTLPGVDLNNSAALLDRLEGLE